MKVKNKKYSKRSGSTLISTSIITGICMLIIFILTVYVIKLLIPFIWYEKLNRISEKYMFVIDKYGYLTSDEKKNLLDDLKNDGFLINNLNIEAPETKKNYGELINFKIEYNFMQKNFVFEDGKFNLKDRTLKLKINKNSYIKR